MWPSLVLVLNFCKGFMQHFRVDFNETLRPVARYTTIRLYLVYHLLSLTIEVIVNADLQDDVDIWCHPLTGINIPRVIMYMPR